MGISRKTCMPRQIIVSRSSRVVCSGTMIFVVICSAVLVCLAKVCDPSILYVAANGEMVGYDSERGLMESKFKAVMAIEEFVWKTDYGYAYHEWCWWWCDVCRAGWTEYGVEVCDIGVSIFFGIYGKLNKFTGLYVSANDCAGRIEDREGLTEQWGWWTGAGMMGLNDNKDGGCTGSSFMGGLDDLRHRATNSMRDGGHSDTQVRGSTCGSSLMMRCMYFKCSQMVLLSTGVTTAPQYRVGAFMGIMMGIHSIVNTSTLDQGGHRIGVWLMQSTATIMHECVNSGVILPLSVHNVKWASRSVVAVEECAEGVTKNASVCMLCVYVYGVCVCLVRLSVYLEYVVWMRGCYLTEHKIVGKWFVGTLEMKPRSALVRGTSSRYYGEMGTCTMGFHGRGRVSMRVSICEYVVVFVVDGCSERNVSYVSGKYCKTKTQHDPSTLDTYLTVDVSSQ